MLGKEKEATHWDKIAMDWHHRSYANEVLAEHKKNTYLKLISRWSNLADSRMLLKTDLFAEAFGPEQFLFELKTNNIVVAIDVSKEIVARAKNQAEHYGIDSSKYLCCDVKHLPFLSNSFDIIISDSTLDHFPRENDIVNAIIELARVLKVGGTLILTIDNKSALTYPPFIFFRFWMKIGMAPYYIGRTLSRKKLKNTLEESGLNLVESTAILHYPHPDGLVRLLEHILRKVSGNRLDKAIGRVLVLLERLEGIKSRYLTGRYLAIKAVKRSI